MNVKGLFEIRNLNELKRFNIRLTLHDQNVSSHSLFTGIISHYIANGLRKTTDIIKPINQYRILLNSLIHDFEECELGDILIPSKSNFKKDYDEEAKKVKSRLFNSLNIEDVELLELESTIVEFSDRIDGLLYCFEEIEFGNSQFKEFGTNYYRRLLKIISKEKEEPAKKYLKEFLKEILYEASKRNNLKEFVDELEVFGEAEVK